MANLPGPLADFLSQGKSADISNAKLAELSHLDNAELETFAKSFATISEDIRVDIIKKLVELTENNVELNFDGIFKCCLRDTNSEVRCQSVEGLWENQEISLISPLLDMLAHDNSDKVRAAAATALGRYVLLGEHGKLRPAYLDRIRDALLAVIKDHAVTEEVRRRSLEAISPLSFSEVQTEISTAYRSQNPRLKVSALFAMGRTCDPVWLPILIEELKNPDAEIRFEAATSLGEISDELAVTPLLGIGGDPDSEVRIAVIQSLGKIGGMKAKEYLQNLLGSRDAAIQDIARQALNELKANEDPLSTPF
jgi:HEAT repeat protein